MSSVSSLNTSWDNWTSSSSSNLFSDDDWSSSNIFNESSSSSSSSSWYPDLDLATANSSDVDNAINNQEKIDDYNDERTDELESEENEETEVKSTAADISALLASNKLVEAKKLLEEVKDDNLMDKLKIAYQEVNGTSLVEDITSHTNSTKSRWVKGIFSLGIHELAVNHEVSQKDMLAVVTEDNED